jgi:hypothetical protein
MKEKETPFAEIIESSLHHWLSQSWQWNQFPVFGSLVTAKTKKRILFGIVYNIQTGSMDPTRYPFTYQKTEEELRTEQPQIFEFLKTTFSCIVVGYQEHNNIVYSVAPEPPTIHTFVSSASPSISKQFLSNYNYLSVLFGQAGTIGTMDELLLAILSYQKSLNVLTQEQLDAFITQFSLLTSNDYRRLKLFLQRVQNIV